MGLRWNRQAVAIIGTLFLASSTFAAPPATIQGSFVVGGVEAGLHHVRATRVALDQQTSGYAVLLSAQPAAGEIAPWQSGDPLERGSFIYLMVESNGAVWIAEIAHAAAQNTHFGVVTEVQVKGFSVSGDRLTAQLTTNGEQTFTDDRYTIDLKIDVPLEK